MEGEGPANGTPVVLGFIAASQNPFALDLALCQTLGIDPKRVPYLDTGSVIEDNAPVQEGDAIERKPFTVPAGAHLLNRVPGLVVKALGSLIWVRPAFSEARCIKCGLCVKACPVKALTLTQKRAAPLLNKKTCITCSCCHEVCPEDAIHMRQSPLLRMAGAFRGLE
jgi:Pyruvate/2-oxoacid:ferredoxin oxidoreductase delta subunit